MKCAKCGQRMIRIKDNQWACANPKCDMYSGRDLKNPNIVQTE